MKTRINFHGEPVTFMVRVDSGGDEHRACWMELMVNDDVELVVFKTNIAEAREALVSLRDEINRELAVSKEGREKS